MCVVVTGQGKQGHHHQQHEPAEKCARPFNLLAEQVGNKVPRGLWAVTHGRESPLSAGDGSRHKLWQWHKGTTGLLVLPKPYRSPLPFLVCHLRLGVHSALWPSSNPMSAGCRQGYQSKPGVCVSRGRGGERVASCWGLAHNWLLGPVGGVGPKLGKKGPEELGVES